MNKVQANVLLVEDSLSLATAYMEYLAKQPCNITHVMTGQEALEAIDAQAPNVVLLDLELPDINGREILEHIREQAIPTAVIIITSHGSVDIAVDVMRAGAIDFLEKPFTADRLNVTLENALRRQDLEEFVDLHRREHYHGFVGASLPMQTVYHIIDSAASSKATVFITGESGTGKEVCAQAIHDASPRHDKPFVALNCAAIPKDLMESEIFGHTRGAFTGAVSAREGAAARADNGTLFLDEICEMDMDLQSKLLRFIQTSTFQKVGSNTLQSVDVRFVCATNRDPMEEVRAGRFREDLYYRLHVIPVDLPPLRQREDDVILIAHHLLETYTREENKHFERFTPETESILRTFEWPGNVRQLQNVIRNIVVLNDQDIVTPSMLPPPLSEISASMPTLSTQSESLSGEIPLASGSTDSMTFQPLW
ncbi:MAG: sigma-54 dependent transcriptional regulator, partial [Gammaproteobacteria bacterium]|nr:sigma-54 dependent transcriptional regulator [Gammaproteobacteria bacterium]